MKTFVRLFGDVTGDGVVNTADTASPIQLKPTAQAPYTQDFEYDGKDVIDETDIAQFEMATWAGPVRRSRPPPS